MINGWCEGMVCVKGCNTENDNGLCDYLVSVDGLCEPYYLVCVIIWFVQINVLCEGMVCVKGCYTESDKWFV